MIYSIWDNKYARSDSPQFATIKGSEGETEEHRCQADFDVIDQDVSCVFESPIFIGDYRCVSLRTGGSDGLDTTQVFEIWLFKFMSFSTKRFNLLIDAIYLNEYVDIIWWLTLAAAH